MRPRRLIYTAQQRRRLDASVSRFLCKLTTGPLARSRERISPFSSSLLDGIMESARTRRDQNGGGKRNFFSNLTAEGVRYFGNCPLTRGGCRPFVWTFVVLLRGSLPVDRNSPVQPHTKGHMVRPTSHKKSQNK
jgi:hypothetical protein